MATFRDLPAELMLKIFKDVPAAHVQRIRRVCKKFRDTIDMNISSLSNDICTRELARFQEDVDYLLGSDVNMTLYADGLNRWCNLRDVWGSQVVQMSCLKNYVPPEKQCDYESSSTNGRRDKKSFYGMIRDTASRLLKSPAKRHTWAASISKTIDGKQVRSKQPFCTCDEMSGLVESVPDLDEDWAKQIYYVLRHLDDSRQSVGPGSPTYLKRIIVDLLPLLGLYSITGSISNPTREPPNMLEIVAGIGDRWTAVVSMSELSRVFSVPSLPRRYSGGRRIAYCVRSSGAQLEIERSQLQQGVLHPLKKAALLQEMFIY